MNLKYLSLTWNGEYQNYFHQLIFKVMNSQNNVMNVKIIIETRCYSTCNIVYNMLNNINIKPSIEFKSNEKQISLINKDAIKIFMYSQNMH